MAATFTDELMNIQRLLFDGYMRTEILLNFKSELSNIMTDDVINLCNKFFVVNIDEMMTNIKISKKIDGDSIDYQLRKLKKLSKDLIKNKHYFIATILLNSLITKENEIKQSYETKKSSHDPDSKIDDQDDFEQKWADKMEDYYLLPIDVSEKWDPDQYDASAWPIFEKLTALKPHKDIHFHDFGIYLEDLEEFEAAISKFKTAVALKDTEPDYLLEIGYCYSFLNQYDEAKKWFLKAIEMAPNYYRCHQEFARFLSMRGTMGDLESAEIHYKKAIELDPENADALRRYAKFLMVHRKDYKESRKYFIRSLELKFFDYSTTIASYAYLLHLMGDDENAREYMKIQLDVFGYCDHHWAYFYDGLLNEEREETSLLKAVAATRTSHVYQLILKDLELMKQTDEKRIDYYQRFEKLLHDKFKSN